MRLHIKDEEQGFVRDGGWRTSEELGVYFG